MVSRSHCRPASLVCVSIGVSITAAAAASDCVPPMFPAALYDVGTGGRPAIHDIDGDGDVDLIYPGDELVPQAGPGLPLVPGAWMLLNNGCGSFDHAPVPVGNKQYSVAIGDMNHDRRPDLAFTTYSVTDDGDSAMWAEVVLNNGDGSFSHAAQVLVPKQTRDLIVADFNADGHLDVVVVAPMTEVTWTGALLLLAGGGDGSLAAPMSAIEGVGYFQPRVADMDEDGAPDIVCAFFDLGRKQHLLRVLRGSGDGQLAILAEISLDYGLKELRVTDVNADGHTDVVALASEGPRVYYGNGRGQLADYALPSGKGDPHHWGMDVGDADGDGDLDILTTADDYVGPGVHPWLLRVHRNLGDGRFAEPRDGPWPLDPIASNGFDLADLNADTLPDMVTVPEIFFAPARQMVLFGRGDGSFDWPEERIPGFTPTAVAAGDVTGDGLTDMVYLTPMRVFPGIGEGEFGPPTQYGMTGVCNAAILADLENDGDLDVVAISNVWPDGAQVAMQEEGAFWASSPFPTDPPRDFAIGDFDGNGIGDIVTVSWEQDSISVLLSLFPLFYWSAVELPHVMIGLPHAVATGDVNGDSLIDFVVKHTYGGQGPGISVYLSHGDGTFAEPQEYFADSGGTWADLVLADLDRGGDLDACYGGGLVVHLNDGHGDFSAQLTNEYSSSYGLAAVEDFNGDGVLDAALGKSNTLAILIGKGDGTFHQLREFYFALPNGLSTDFDNDGDVDLIGFKAPAVGDPGSPVQFITNRTPHKLPADLDGDGIVNGHDLALLLAAWGACPAKSPCPADLDGSGVVNGVDLALLLSAWG